MRLKFILCTFWVCASYHAQAQNYNHFAVWTRLALQKNIYKNFEVNVEYHFRRQNDYRDTPANPFALPLLEAYRLGIVHRGQNITVSLFNSFFHSYPLYAKTSDFNRKDRWEFRPFLMTEWIHSLSPKWLVRLRGGYEYRLFKNDDNEWNESQGRARLRGQIRYIFNPKNNLFLSEELLQNVPPNVPANSFSQNQLYLGYSHNFSPHFTLETGYMWNHRQRSSLIEFDEEHSIQTHFIVRL
ncbi:DUF2490 domain-containing protein [Flectobacillus sp. BAB-3569]|uniref:DUF2490 domain-containing protein n=1 Tax=Flectobacillus sp. BAB-3569 TaxID=1509483 RepID=UPI000BA32B14|nr:DUF2490 domain-containing protein [Flectobacillus sp. BAB-3569]PAC27583.1 hypothetical protein BWI92_22025 [Flectobacillus sp. BAB-3569]